MEVVRVPRLGPSTVLFEDNVGYMERNDERVDHIESKIAYSLVFC